LGKFSFHEQRWKRWSWSVVFGDRTGNAAAASGVGRGYVDILERVGCGDIASKDIPQQSAEKLIRPGLGEPSESRSSL